MLGYDGANRVNGVSLPDGNSIGASYDGNDNQTSLAPPGRSSHLFSFWPNDLEKDYTPPAVDVNGTGNVHTEWDLDRAVSSITPTGMAPIVPHYDAVKGRLNSLDYGTRTNTFDYSTTTGQLASITAPDGKLSYTYEGPLLKSQTWSLGLVNGAVTRTTYDANFWLKAESYGGQSISYDYDNDGLLKLAGAMTITRDLTTGFVSGTVLGNVTDALGYDPAYGELSDAQAKYQGNNLLHVHYDLRDALGRIKEKTETVLGEAPHVYQYDYDPVGRLREVVRDCVGSSFPAWSSTASYAAGECVAYAGLKYRALTDQSTANHPDISPGAWEQQHAYTYDANGNRLTAPGLTSTPVYDAQDRMLAYGNCTYAYKSDGSLQTKTCPDGTTSYDYDSFGNLRHVTLPGGTNIDYLVDGQNRRIGKKVNGVLVEGFLYRNQLQPAVWLNGDGSIRATFVYGLRPNVPEYMVQGGTAYRLITDQVGTVRLVVNTATGAVAERVDWDAFGNAVADSAPGLQPFGFAGGLRDLDTGLMRFGARDLEAATGRWTTKDALLFGGAATNVYEYTGNDPINLIDPTGRFARICVSGSNVTIVIPANFYGNGANPANINSIVAEIERKWTGQFGQFNVVTHVTSGPENSIELISPADLKNVSFASHVVGGHHGIWASEEEQDVYAHEAGHLLGLPDRYKRETGEPDPLWWGSIMASTRWGWGPLGEDIGEAIHAPGNSVSCGGHCER